MKDNDNRIAWPLILLIGFIIALPISAVAFFRLKNRKEDQIVAASIVPLPEQNIEPIQQAEIITTNEIDFTNDQEDLNNQIE